MVLSGTAGETCGWEPHDAPAHLMPSGFQSNGSEGIVSDIDRAWKAQMESALESLKDKKGQESQPSCIGTRFLLRELLFP